MRKLILIFALGQFILAAVLICMCIQFQNVTADSEKTEKDFSEKCFKLQEALNRINDTYADSHKVINNVSRQLPKIGKVLKATGNHINEKWDNLPEIISEASKICKDTANLLRECNEETIPGVQQALASSADNLKKSDGIIKNSSTQLIYIGNGLQTTGKNINRLAKWIPGSKESGTPLVNLGIEFHNIAGLMEQYASETSPNIQFVLRKSAENLANSNEVIKNLSEQMLKIGDNLNNTAGVNQNKNDQRIGDLLIEAGELCDGTTNVLKNYCKSTAPLIQENFKNAADIAGGLGKSISVNKHYTKGARYTLTLFICFIVICLMNGIALSMFAFNKNNSKPSLQTDDEYGSGKITRNRIVPVNHDSQNTIEMPKEEINYSQKSRALFVTISIFPVTGLLGINNFYAGHSFRGVLKILALIAAYAFSLEIMLILAVLLYIFCIIEAFFIKKDAHDRLMPWFN